jgi:hypothetical protein
VICICDYQINTTMQQFAYTGRSLVHMHGIATLRYASTSLSSKRKRKRKIAQAAAATTAVSGRARGQPTGRGEQASTISKP